MKKHKFLILLIFCFIIIAFILLYFEGILKLNNNVIDYDGDYHTESYENQSSSNDNSTNVTDNGFEKNGKPSVINPIGTGDENSTSDKLEFDNNVKAPDKKNPNESPTNVSSNIVNILFLGIDRTQEREETRIASGADTIMLARLDIDNKKLKVLSIPRDTYVYIPIIDRMNKINSSYSYGLLKGKEIESTFETIEQLIPEANIDYYFTLDMEPVPDIIDDLGGVEIDVEIDMKSHGVNLSKGLQLLDGKSAFDYIHWRYAEDGDIGRIRRQHNFVMALFRRLNSSEAIDLVKVLLTYEYYINTDLGIEQIKNLIKLCSEIKTENIKFSILPGEGKYMDNISYWILNETKVKETLNAFFSD